MIQLDTSTGISVDRSVSRACSDQVVALRRHSNQYILGSFMFDTCSEQIEKRSAVVCGSRDLENTPERQNVVHIRGATRNSKTGDDEHNYKNDRPTSYI